MNVLSVSGLVQKDLGGGGVKVPSEVLLKVALKVVLKVLFVV